MDYGEVQGYQWMAATDDEADAGADAGADGTDTESEESGESEESKELSSGEEAASSGGEEEHGCERLNGAELAAQHVQKQAKRVAAAPKPLWTPKPVPSMPLPASWSMVSPARKPQPNKAPPLMEWLAADKAASKYLHRSRLYKPRRQGWLRSSRVASRPGICMWALSQCQLKLLPHSRSKLRKRLQLSCWW